MRPRLRSILTGLAAFSLAGIASAGVVTFDDIGPPSGNAIHTFATSGGFDFNGGHFHIIDTPDARVVDNGTQFLGAEAAGGLGKAVTMTQTGGGLFTLNGLEVAEVWRAGESLNDFFYVELTGNQSGGGVLSALITLDGIADGPGGANDFQTVVLGGWTNLMSVTITGRNASGAFGDYSIDNLVVNAVPEPQTWALMLAGLGLVGLAARRRMS